MASKKPQRTRTRKPDPAKVAAKKERRLERQRQEAAARAKEARKARLRTSAFAALAIVASALVGLLIFNALKPGPEIEGVERPPDQGSRHVAPGEAVNYDTATPTSGAHAPSSARCGVLTTGLPLEFAVHNLEHGVVVVWYRPDLEETLLPELRDLIERWDSHVMVAPNPGISDAIVATAWNRLQRFDSVGPELAEFIDVYRKRGLESVPCDIESL